MLQKLNNELLERLKTAKIATGPFPLFDLSPQQVQGFLEAAWEVWLRVTSSTDRDVVNARKPSPDAVLPTLGRVDVEFQREVVVTRDVIRAMLGSSSNDADKNRILVEAAETVLMGQIFDIEDDVDGERRVLSNPLRHWDHLIYAYLIENTRVVEICKKLLEDLLSDEVHGPISDETFRWLRSTEDLFFRHGNSSLISSVTSWVRPDLGATRRNAYQRMFGIDLNHGASNGASYPYARATIANADFVTIFQELLRELWRGYVNSRNTSGSNTTDDSNIRELISRLRNMLRARRLSGSGHQANLAREEFVSVTMMSWFELTVGQDSPVINDLKALDSTIEERLRKLGERVKVPMHGKSRSFFTLAGHLPRLLTLIEQGHFEGSDDTIRALYAPIPGQTNELQASVLQIINHWSIATGVDLKALPTTTGPR